MDNLKHAKVIPLKEFGYAFFFEGCPPEVTSKIFAFSRESALPIVLKTLGFRRNDNRSYNEEYFHEVSQCSFAQYPKNKSEMENWFRNLPLKSEDNIYIIYPFEWVLMTTWGNFVPEWDTFWEPFYRVDIYNDTFDKGMFLGPEEIGYYAERNI